MARNAPAPNPAPRTVAMCRIRTPPTKRMAPVRMARMIVVPMSGWSITSPPKKQNMSPTGRSTERQSPTLAARRVSRSAQ